MENTVTNLSNNKADKTGTSYNAGSCPDNTTVGTNGSIARVYNDLNVRASVLQTDHAARQTLQQNVYNVITTANAFVYPPTWPATISRKGVYLISLYISGNFSANLYMDCSLFLDNGTLISSEIVHVAAAQLTRITTTRPVYISDNNPHNLTFGIYSSQGGVAVYADFITVCIAII